MLYENNNQSSGGVGGTNLRPAMGSGLSRLFAKSGGIADPDAIATKEYVQPHPEPLPGKQQPFAYTSAGHTQVNWGLLKGANMYAYHFNRREFKQGM